MLPLLHEKQDLVVITKKGPERCRKYDTVLFKRGHKYVLHRIIKVCPDSYVIVGDNQFIKECVKEEQILGVMTRFIRKGKDISADNKLYLLYVHLWCDFYPIRAAVLHAQHMAFRVRRKLWRMRRERQMKKSL